MGVEWHSSVQEIGLLPSPQFEFLIVLDDYDKIIMNLCIIWHNLSIAILYWAYLDQVSRHLDETFRLQM